MLAPAFVRGDSEKLRLVLRNLLDNALKYTPEGGDSVTVSVIIKTDTVYITIEDRGEGIPDTALPFLFEPFFRADASRSRKTGGFGLGLSLCKTVVDAHKGRIEVTSTPGEGTRVVVILPSFLDTD
jgi:signal transduction histidine kinase